MIKDYKASIVIPAYNAEKYLADTLRSCLNQSMKRIEIIVVDDGSTDGTVDIVRTFQDERLRLVMLEKNQGRSAARNAGIQEAKSDVIAICDADDLCINQRINHSLKALKNADIVYGQFVRIDALGNVIDTIDARQFSVEEVKKTLFTFICHSSMAFKKKVWNKVKYTSGEWCSLGIDDWKFQMDCYKAKFKFLEIKKPLVMYRSIEKDRDEKRVTELKLKWLNENLE